MKVSELEGYELDFWVAKAAGYEQTHPYRWIDSDGNTITDGIQWEPSTMWSQGGKIIENNEIDLSFFGPEGDRYCQANVGGKFCQHKYPLVAAMRAYVASKFGEEV